MANLRGAPSWVQVQPTDFSGALLKGFQTGMSLADMQNKIQESNAQRAMEAQKQSEAAALAQWETQQRMELEREKLAQAAATERAQQEALDQWRQGQLENQALANAIDEKQLAETVRYNTGKLNEPNIHYGAQGEVLQEVIDPTTGQPTIKVLREANAATNQTPQEANRKSILMKQEADLRGKLNDAWDLSVAGDTSIVPTLNNLIRQYESVSGQLTNAPAATTVTPSSTNRLERLNGVNPASTNRVTTQAQFDALPSGTIYIGADGKRYRKP